MTWIKICGTTNVEDALMCVEAGADALGFVFHDQSPRYVAFETVQKIMTSLPDHIERVGVFVSPTAEQIKAAAEVAGITAAQIYLDRGSADFAEFIAASPQLRWIPSATMTLRSELEFAGYSPERVHALLLDSGSAKTPGGTGQPFDWTASAREVGEIKRLGKIIVAGGLHPANVAEAIRILEPWGVDVVSGVEANPGKKDPVKVRAFIKAVKEAKRK